MTAYQGENVVIKFNKYHIRSNDINSVIVADRGGFAVAQFFYQRGKDGVPKFDAYQMATKFIEMSEAV